MNSAEKFLLYNKYAVVDFHSSHANLPPHDDGVNSVADIVKAALEKFVLPVRTGHNTTEGAEEAYDVMKMWGVAHLALAGVELEFVNDSPAGIQQSGEIVVDFEYKHLGKMRKAVDTWRDNGWNKTKDLHMLLQHLKGEMGDDYKDLLKIYPHPFFIGNTWLSKFLLRNHGGGSGHYGHQITDEGIINEIDGIEVYNASHVGYMNRKAGKLAQKKLSHTAGIGSSDSHSVSTAASGATVVRLEEICSAGIIAGVKRGDTVPVTGLGKSSEGWWPFLHAAMHYPIAGKQFPEWISKHLQPKNNIKEAAEDAINHRIGKRGRVFTWHYPGKKYK